MQKTIFSLCALMAVVMLSGFGCVRPGPRIVRTPTPATTPAPAALAYARLNGGTATLVRDEQSTSLQDGQALGSGDEIKTQTGTVELVYPDAGVGQLEAGTDIVLLAQSDEVNEGEVSTEIQLIAGQIWTRFERLLGSTEQYAVSANGVVATVRGTSFGVRATGEDIDVQVADHQVDVTSETPGQSQVEAKKAFRIVAGQAIKLKAGQVGISPAMAQRLIRNLSAQEKRTVGFVFGAAKLSKERLKRPAKIIPLLKHPNLPERFKSRFEILKQREAARRALIRFSAPTTTPALNTTSDPAASGPIEIKTEATLLINGKPL